MNVRYIRPADLFDAVPYAYASVIEAGSLVFTAGACPLDSEGTIVGPGDYEAQARQAVDNLFVTLAAAGLSPTAVVKSTVYVVSDRREDLVRVWDVIRGAFGDHDPPSTLLGVSSLGWPEQLVEIEAVAIGAIT